MGSKNNKVCIICQSPYHYCPTCSSGLGKPSWYSIFDGQNCYDIYEVCTAYRDGKIDGKEAYDKITKLDISKLDDFAESTKSQIKEILKYKHNEEKEVSKVVEKTDYKKKNK